MPRHSTKQTLSQTEDETFQQEVCRPRRRRRRLDFNKLRRSMVSTRRPGSELSEHTQCGRHRRQLNKLWRALVSTRSEHDEHADIIRAKLNKPAFDVNELKVWYDGWSAEAALHVSCGNDIRSHVGAQLLLNDERCDVNLQYNDGDTALMKTVGNIS